jgi:anaerobic selenocysteine-containing dehydrogenase
VLQQLAHHLQLRSKWLFEDPWEAMERALEKALEEGGFRRLLKGERLKLRGFPREKYPTPSSRIEFVSSVAKQHDINPLPSQLSLERTKDEFILLNSATPKYTHTQFRDVYGPIPVFVWINPKDAKALSIQTDDLILLENSGGQIQVKAKVVTSVPQGVLWAPRQFIGINNESQNSLMPATPQQIGKGSTFNSAIVQITKSN